MRLLRFQNLTGHLHRQPRVLSRLNCLRVVIIAVSFALCAYVNVSRLKSRICRLSYSSESHGKCTTLVLRKLVCSTWGNPLAIHSYSSEPVTGASKWASPMYSLQRMDLWRRRSMLARYSRQDWIRSSFPLMQPMTNNLRTSWAWSPATSIGLWQILSKQDDCATREAIAANYTPRQYALMTSSMRRCRR